MVAHNRIFQRQTLRLNPDGVAGAGPHKFKCAPRPQGQRGEVRRIAADFLTADEMADMVIKEYKTMSSIRHVDFSAADSMAAKKEAAKKPADDGGA